MTSITRYKNFQSLKLDLRFNKTLSDDSIMRHEELKNFLNILRCKLLDNQLQEKEHSKNIKATCGK
jgi:hypothetical protein